VGDGYCPGLVMLGYGAADAIGASLFADTVASLVVSWTYYQAGNVNLRQAGGLLRAPFWVRKSEATFLHILLKAV